MDDPKEPKIDTTSDKTWATTWLDHCLAHAKDESTYTNEQGADFVCDHVIGDLPWDPELSEQVIALILANPRFYQELLPLAKKRWPDQDLHKTLLASPDPDSKEELLYPAHTFYGSSVEPNDAWMRMKVGDQLIVNGDDGKPDRLVRVTRKSDVGLYGTIKTKLHGRLPAKEEL